MNMHLLVQPHLATHTESNTRACRFGPLPVEVRCARTGLLTENFFFFFNSPPVCTLVLDPSSIHHPTTLPSQPLPPHKAPLAHARALDRCSLRGLAL